MAFFNSRDPRFKRPFGAAAAGETVSFTIMPGEAESARLAVRPDEGVAQYAVMTRAAGGSFSCALTPPAPGLYWYWFELCRGGAGTYLCRGPGGEGLLGEAMREPWQLTVYDKSYETPAWVKGGVMYQIFPDRFSRAEGAPPELPAGRALREDWGGLPGYLPDESGRVLNNDYFGGNLRGIVEKLPYLAGLGITVLYLNPIFEAHSNHRYNTADYMKIDPLLGREEDLKQLCALAAEYGMRVILDGVFNHTGDDSVYFNRLGRYPGAGAYQAQGSPYYGWYSFKSWPGDYDCWWGFKTLPTVNKKSAAFNSFIAGDGGVLEHWMAQGVAGWRLDVADELPEPFIAQMRQRIKSPGDGMLIGEVWEDASNKVSYGRRRHYLEGGELDSVMNYPLRSAVLGFFKTGDAAALDGAVMTILENYPPQAVQALMNIMGTHDTVRLITALAGEDAAGRSKQWRAEQAMTERQRDEGARLVTLAAAIQFFLPGVPCVYYGDEAGLEGYEDPFNRRCYPWGGEDIRLIGWYRRLGVIRRACPALAGGAYACLGREKNFYAFMRSDGADALICAVNAGGQPCCIALPPEERRRFVPVDGLPVDTEQPFCIPAGGCRVLGAGEWAGAFAAGG